VTFEEDRKAIRWAWTMLIVLAVLVWIIVGLWMQEGP
jgi:cell division protein FtsB